ncbi:class I SAM-dependent methyltransferase [Lihuaxuella thermophila]|uniref:Methyltransferase domain-containing protein n=1 Tax=Lihuaxuella thermophila TaxID=1173111 RepID=A0A1H8B6Z5_9BACL|nr:class I SAM-dependent methyltransferase [Lihuaxuella thermophila]SEM78750.1 Methyltransferase domain-containing protein [Lihuaxuella thermophila]
MSMKASKGYKGIGMNGPIAWWYAKNTRKNIVDYKKDAKRVASMVSDGAAILELAPGPGYLAIELAKLGNYQVTGLDISHSFVEIARANAKEAGVSIDFRQGDAAAMPFDDESFDFIICRAAFKNFAQPVTALDEINRVLKNGGKAVIIDLRGDVSIEAINKHVEEDLNLSGFNLLLTKWAFKSMLIKRAYTKDQFRELVSKSSFRTCELQEDTIGVEVWLEK